MKTVYPEILWKNTQPNTWVGSAEGYDIRVSLHLGGLHAGKWTSIINNGAIQSGGGQHGYDFDTSNEARRASEDEVKLRIDQRVKEAEKVISLYTDVNLPLSA